MDVFTRWVKSTFTLNDNRTPDLYPMGLFALVFGLLGLSAWSIYMGHPFSPSEFGVGGGSILGLHGLAKKFDQDPTDLDAQLLNLGKEKADDSQ